MTVSWTLSGGDNADFYLINITTNAPQSPYGGLLNTTISNVTQHELNGFMAGYEYNLTVRGVNCGSLVGIVSEPLTTRPQGMYILLICNYAMFCVTMNHITCLEIVPHLWPIAIYILTILSYSSCSSQQL